MSTAKKLQSTLAGSGGDALYVDDLFSTYLYEGDGSARTFNLGIDLANEGGMVWTKQRSGTEAHVVLDTERGAAGDGGGFLRTNTNEAEDFLTTSYGIDSFTDNGYTTGSGFAGGSPFNVSGFDYVSWTFRKAPKFFDVVTWTGTGGKTTINHNLDGVVGCIIIKRTDSSGWWHVSHRGTTTPYWDEMYLQRSDAAYVNTGNVDNVTSTSFDTHVNQLGASYVAYLFAHNDGDGEFGTDGDQDIIKCGSFVPSSTWQSVIDIGFEPQWIMYKKATASGDWYIHDNMRGIVAGAADNVLYANTSDAEVNYIDSFTLHPNGFEQTFSSVNTNTYIYIAIRRPHKPAESGDEVFAADLASGYPRYPSGFASDLVVQTARDSGSNGTYTRLTGTKALRTTSTNSEFNSVWDWSLMDGAGPNYTNSNSIGWSFKRSPGFFDVVCYEGTGSARTVDHNLGVEPEMMIIKNRDNGSDVAYGWWVYHTDLGATNRMYLNGTQAVASSSVFNNTTPTDEVFSVNGSSATGASGDNYIAYLFASQDGISKVGSYTGNASTLNIDCGFSSGARFVLIKRTDSTEHWYVFDSERGIVSGSDAILKMNTTDAETSADWIDPYSSGFTLDGYSDINRNGGNYIYLAIA